MNGLVRRVPATTISPISSFSRDDFFRPFEQMFDNIVNQVMGQDFKQLKTNSGYPKLDVITHEGKFIIEVAIPGVSPEDVRVEIEPPKGNVLSDTLHISGHMETIREDANYHVRELSRKSFRRSMYLPDGLNGDPEAVFRNGLLTLTWHVEDHTPKPENRVISIESK